MPKQSTRANFIQALIAVLAGNATYYLLMPYLPVGARHRALHYDLGLVVDFWFCLVAFGIVKMIVGWRERRRTTYRSQ
jgi:hypothetical protein